MPQKPVEIYLFIVNPEIIPQDMIPKALTPKALMN
jgi:hypothetical protein